MRAAYLAPDRMDISESINCLRRHTQPREGHTIWCPPCKMKKNGSSRTLDSAWAGELGSRRSNPTRGKHRLPPVSTVQTCIGLSSAESDLHALTRRGCSAMGTQSHLADRHVPTANILFSDASAKRCNAEERSRKAEMCSNETLLVVGTEIRRWSAQTSQCAHGKRLLKDSCDGNMNTWTTMAGRCQRSDHGTTKSRVDIVMPEEA